MEHRSFDNFDATTRKDGQGHCRSFEVLRSRSRLNVPVIEFVPIFASPHLSPCLRVIGRVVSHPFVYLIDDLRHRVWHKIGKLRVYGKNVAACRCRGHLQELEKVMSGDITAPSDVQRKIGVQLTPFDKLAKASLRDSRAGVLREGTYDNGFAALDENFGDCLADGSTLGNCVKVALALRLSARDEIGFAECCRFAEDGRCHGNIIIEGKGS